MNATNSTCNPGDILFYAAVKGSITDSIISGWTHSPIVHVAVAVSRVMKIEALGAVVQSPIDARTIAAIWPCPQSDPARLAQALTWLHGQVGMMYGWGDIANAFLQNWEHGLSINIENHFDCSGLATIFLQIAGVAPTLIGVDPHTVTPAALVRYLGIPAPPA